MTTYTTRPSPHWSDYTDIFESDVERMSVPNDEIDKWINHLKRSSHNHWQRVFDRKDDPKTVIANGHAYHIGEPTDNPRGFGGKRWIIYFLDGRIETTVSLWHYGEIPSEWRDKLPDNATI